VIAVPLDLLKPEFDALQGLFVGEVEDDQNAMCSSELLRAYL
jgi:hypothetical protein